MMYTVGRFALGALIASFSAAGTAWLVTDLITDKYAAGFQSAVGSLTTTVADLSVRLQAESNILRNERDSLAIAIADQIRDSDTAQNRQVDGVSSGLNALTLQLRETTLVIGRLSGAVDELGKNMTALSARLATSDARQVEFERYVVSVLLTSPPTRRTSAEIQSSWGVSKDVIDLTGAGILAAEPLALWAKFATPAATQPPR